MDEAYGFEPADEDDVATMVAELEGRLDRAAIARAIGVRPSELDLIAAGHEPEREAVERLRLLYRLSAKTKDLRDPEAVLGSLGLPGSTREVLSLTLGRRWKRYVVAFIVVDALVFGGFVVALVLSR